MSEQLYTKKGRVRKRKPKQERNYFNEDTEVAIIQYVASTDNEERNKIFNEHLDYAFYKLSENIINNFNFAYKDGETIEDKIQELIVFMLGKMYLYKQEKGKAYSYFGTMAKRYMINDNIKNYQKAKNKIEVNDFEELEENNSYVREIINEQNYEGVSNFMNLYVEYIDTNLEDLFPKDKDLKIADAIMELFRKRESLDVFNKKALYIYIREMINVGTPQITRIIKKLKKIYDSLFNKYFEDGHL
jgi:hypothetical protein